MKRVYIIRKGVSLAQIQPVIDFINDYRGGIMKAVYFEDRGNQSDDLSAIKELMQQCNPALLILGDNPDSSKYANDEIELAHILGLRRSAYTLAEHKYPAGTSKGIPKSWKFHSNVIMKANSSNILRGILGPIKWGVS